jgi:hypothetical protein
MGVSTGLNEAFYIKSTEARKIEPIVIRNLIKNSDIVRYAIIPRDTRLIFTPEIDNPVDIPNTIEHLLHFEHNLRKRRGCDTDESWYKYKEDQNYDLAEYFDRRIITTYRGVFPRFSIAPRRWHGCTDTYSLVPEKNSKWDEFAILAVLNSSFIRQYFDRYGKKKGDIIEFFTRPIQSLPIPHDPQPSLSLLAKEVSSRATELVSLLIGETARLNVLFQPTYSDVLSEYERMDGKQKRIKELCKEIADLEEQIDSLVWGLYGFE